ncbi:hypothetical protein AAVH_33158 [Aphelenchoides avenae]|nr:hypothetical protein AAVH_33158 [Aphelenchus avenae]
MGCINCADAQETKKALALTADALRAKYVKLLRDYKDMLENRENDKAEMERLDRLVKLHSEREGPSKKRNK